MSETQPVLDLSVITTSENPPTDIELSSKAAELHDALSLTGFVLLTNHGISKESITSMYASGINFFQAPDHVKEEFQKPKDRVAYHGYNFASDLSHHHKYREYFHWWPNNPEPNMFIKGEEEPTYNVKDIEIRPRDFLRKFSYSNQSLISECNLLCKNLFTLLATALQLPDPKYFDAAHQGLENRLVPNHTYLASIFYPPLGDEYVMPRNKERMGVHTDWDTFTLLFMDPIGGLEAKTVSGDWVPTDPIVDLDGNLSILLIVGDFLEKWSGGIYRATEHRVLIPSGENRLKNRLSIPYFVLPDNAVEIKPILAEVDDKNAKCAENESSSTLNVGEYFERNAFRIFNKPREI